MIKKTERAEKLSGHNRKVDRQFQVCDGIHGPDRLCIVRCLG